MSGQFIPTMCKEIRILQGIQKNMEVSTLSDNQSKEYEVPYVAKESLSLIAIEGSNNAHALRSVLELYNYRVETHWVGSRKELIKILNGEIPTHKFVVIDSHGDEGGFEMRWEPTLSAEELTQIVNLPERIFVSLGCSTGNEPMARAFLNGGCKAYIAPIEGIRGDSTAFFAFHFFYYLANGKSLEQAVEESRKFDEETGYYRLYR